MIIALNILLGSGSCIIGYTYSMLLHRDYLINRRTWTNTPYTLIKDTDPVIRVIRVCWGILCIFILYTGFLTSITCLVLKLTLFLLVIVGPVLLFVESIWYVIFYEITETLPYPRKIIVLVYSLYREPGAIESRRLVYFLHKYGICYNFYLSLFLVLLLVIFMDLLVLKVVSVAAILFCTYILFLRRGYGVFGTVDNVRNDHLPNLYYSFTRYLDHPSATNFPSGMLKIPGRVHSSYFGDFEKDISSMLILSLVNIRIAQYPLILKPRPIPHFDYYLRIRKSRGKPVCPLYSLFDSTEFFRLVGLSEVLKLRSNDVFLSCNPNHFRYNMFYYYIVVRTQVVFRRNIYFLLAISGLSISAVLLFSGYHLFGATLLFFCLLLFFKAYRARQLPLALSIPHTPLFLRIYIKLSHVEPFRLFRVGHAILCLHTFLEDFRLSKDEGFRRMRYLRHKLRRKIRHRLRAIRLDSILAGIKTFRNYDELRHLLLTDPIIIYGTESSLRFGPVLHALRRYLRILLVDSCRLFLIIVILVVLCSVFIAKILFYF